MQADWILVEDFEDVADKSRAQLVTDDWFYGFEGPLAAAEPAQALDDDEVCRLVMSSGTTGTPKPLAFTPRILADRIYTRIALNADCSPERTLMAFDHEPDGLDGRACEPCCGRSGAFRDHP